MELSIILVNYKNKKLTEDCIDSIKKANLRLAYEIIVVDNCSNDGGFEYLKEKYEDKNVKVIQSGFNGGFAYGNNVGIRESSGEYIYIFNNDTILFPNVTEEMYSIIKNNNRIGAIGCKAIDRDGNILNTYQSFENSKRIFLQSYIKPVTEKIGIQRMLVDKFMKKQSNDAVIYSDWIVGSAILLSRNVYNEVNGLDENYFMYMEDEDLCRRIGNLGYKIATLNKVGYIHYCGGSTINSAFLIKEYIKSRLIFFNRYEKNSYNFVKKMLFNRMRNLNSKLSINEINNIKQEINEKESDFLEKSVKIKGINN